MILAFVMVVAWAMAEMQDAKLLPCRVSDEGVPEGRGSVSARHGVQVDTLPRRFAPLPHASRKGDSYALRHAISALER